MQHIATVANSYNSIITCTGVCNNGKYYGQCLLKYLSINLVRGYRVCTHELAYQPRQVLSFQWVVLHPKPSSIKMPNKDKLPVMSWGDRFCTSRKGSIGVSGWVHLKSENSTAVSGLSPLVCVISRLSVNLPRR